jgi:small subunit ribosomal protein S1
MLTMEEALRQSGRPLRFAVGEIVQGTVIEVRPKEVLVDIGYKSEGAIPASEFDDLSAVKVGDKVDVLIEKLEDKDGMVVLSREKAEFKKNWERILQICNEGGRVSGKVKSVVKGGLMVNIGVEAFLPASQVDVVAPKNLAQYVGQTLEFKVVKINPDRQNVVLSRRELIEQERAERRAKLLAEMMPGDIRKGTVKNITDFGAFIDLNGIDGLLHVTDMSWGRINHPSELLKVGQEIDVVVLDVNREKERVSLGLKQKMANPWDNIEQKYPVGARVKGRVVNLVPYGAFVELEPGVEGLVHVTELSWTKRIAKPSDVLKVGQEIEAMVLGINRDEQKISLGIRQLEANPWDTAEQKYPVGTRVKGKIRNLTSYGAFLELEEGLDGMIHVSDISWTRKINHPSEVFKKGDEVEAVVLEVDRANQRIALGVKQLTPDPWENIDQLYKVGDLVTGKVTKLASFGAFVGLQHDIDGLVHISQISEERVDKIKNVLKVGQEVTARVIKIDKAERRIGLSIKAANYTPEQLKAEQAALDALKPGEDLVALQHAFDLADEARQKEEKEQDGQRDESR